MSAAAKPQAAQFEMDWWFPHSRAVVTKREVAQAFQISEDQVRNLFDAGLIVAAGVSDHAAPQREHLRFERWSVVAWRLNQLEDQGVEMPLKEDPQTTWWRQELRKRATGTK